MTAKLKKVGQTLRKRLHEKTKGTAKWLESVVRGYFQYHAVPCNEERLKAFRHEVLRMWWRQLRRRSQPSRWSWARFQENLGPYIPEVLMRGRRRTHSATRHISGDERQAH